MTEADGMDLIRGLAESVRGFGDRLAEIAGEIDRDAQAKGDLLRRFDEACRRAAEEAGNEEAGRGAFPYPRFEDGEPVRVRDGFTADDGTACVARRVTVYEEDDRLLYGAVYDAEGNRATVNLSLHERVKRPEPLTGIEGEQ